MRSLWILSSESNTISQIKLQTFLTIIALIQLKIATLSHVITVNSAKYNAQLIFHSITLHSYVKHGELDGLNIEFLHTNVNVSKIMF